jgi:hypothetical protein
MRPQPARGPVAVKLSMRVYEEADPYYVLLNPEGAEMARGPADMAPAMGLLLRLAAAALKLIPKETLNSEMAAAPPPAAAPRDGSPPITLLS